MKNKLLIFIMIFLLLSPSITFNMEITDNLETTELNDADIQDLDFMAEEMDIQYPTTEKENYESEENSDGKSAR